MAYVPPLSTPPAKLAGTPVRDETAKDGAPGRCGLIGEESNGKSNGRDSASKAKLWGSFLSAANVERAGPDSASNRDRCGAVLSIFNANSNVEVPYGEGG